MPDRKSNLPKVPFSIKYSLGLVLLSNPIIPILCALPLLVAKLFGYQLAQNIGLSSHTFYIFTIFLESVTAVVFFILIRKKLNDRKLSWSVVGLNSFRPFKAIKYIIAWPFIIMAVAITLSVIVALVGAKPPDKPASTVIYGGGLLPALLIGSMLAPLIEEVLFRGMLFPSIANRYSVPVGIALSSLVFAVSHLNPLAILMALFLGPYLCWMYRRLGSIYPGMLLHALHNGLITYITLNAR